MLDAAKIQQPEISLFYYNSGKGFVANKFKRVSNLKEIFKYKSKSVKSPRMSDGDAKLFNNSIHQKNKDGQKNSLSEKHRQTQVRKNKKLGSQRRTITNFTVFNPRLPVIYHRQAQNLHLKSLQFTQEQQQQETIQNNIQQSLNLQSPKKGKKNIHLLINNNNLKSTQNEIYGKKNIFHFCNLELEENVGIQNISNKKNKQKQSVRIRRKKAENIADWHVNHKKRISMFEIEGPKAFGINQNFQFRETSKKRYNIETIYISEFGSKIKKEGKSIPIKEREGSQKLGGWDNKSDSSGQYF